MDKRYCLDIIIKTKGMPSICVGKLVWPWLLVKATYHAGIVDIIEIIDSEGVVEINAADIDLENLAPAC